MRLIGLAVLPLSLAAAFAQLPQPAPADTPAPRQSLEDYNLTWTTPGPDASASMPLGNGEVGINLWTEPNGDIVFYLARTDSFSEASRLMKLGRVRVSIEPSIVQPGFRFSQKLDLARGVITISSTTPGNEHSVDIYFAPDRPVVYVTGRFELPRSVKVSLEVWRTEKKKLNGSGPDAELTSSWTMHDAPMEVWESADHILDDPTRVLWCHRNDDSIVPMSIKHQGLESVAASIPDALLHRTFGGAITATPAASFSRTNPTTLQSTAPVSTFTISVLGHTAQTPTIDVWREQVDLFAEASADAAGARRRNDASWAARWNRSYIFVDGDKAAGTGVPRNTHPITFGQDSTGGNTFRGELNRAGAYGQVLSDQQIFRNARGRPESPPPFPRERVLSFVSTSAVGDVAPNSVDMHFPDGFTLDAWIRPAADTTAARILDKVTAGQPDGFLFDIQPGGTLRLVVGDKTLTAPGAVKLDEWNRLAATFNPANSQLRLFVDGKQVAASTPTTLDTDAPSLITRGYILQRYMQACAGRGKVPIKFNGSIFTVDAVHTNGNANVSPDYRRWGDCFWWQNTRLPYHAMLAAGDMDLMAPLFDMYASVLPACEARAKLYHNVSGAYFPETMTFFGLYSNGDYGWDRTGHQSNEVLCPWWQWAWNQGPELVSLMLDRYDYTEDDVFARDLLLPMARSVLLYFDTRFKRDEHGKLVISPTQALETHWHNVVNDMPCVAGLHDVTTRLLAIDAALVSADDRALFARLHDALPALPTREVDGIRLYAPAEKYTPSRQNVETPELANVFPHRLIGIGSADADLQMAREAYARRHDKMTHGWTQDGQFAALLGLTEEARANILAKARNSNPKHRFPAMWGPNFDWLPDQCHGGNLMHVLQTMLLQPRGDKILVLPAWPADWNVSFKLRAPKSTVIECEYRDGKITRLNVTPELRRKDIEVMLGN